MKHGDHQSVRQGLQDGQMEGGGEDGEGVGDTDV